MSGLVDRRRGILALSLEHSSQIERWARSSFPFEACGLILGRVDSSAFLASSVLSLQNVETERPQSRYRMDPVEIFKASRRARARSEGIIGVWHSHPNHCAEPSQADFSSAWADQVYLIVGRVCSERPELRAWRLNETESEFSEVALEPLLRFGSTAKSEEADEARS